MTLHPTTYAVHVDGRPVGELRHEPDGWTAWRHAHPLRERVGGTYGEPETAARAVVEAATATESQP